MTLLTALLEALRKAFLMLWGILWGLCAVVERLVSKSEMLRLLPDAGARSSAVAAGLGGRVVVMRNGTAGDAA